MTKRIFYKKGGENMTRLEELAKEIKDILSVKYNPHCAVLITNNGFSIISVEHSTPLE